MRASVWWRMISLAVLWTAWPEIAAQAQDLGQMPELVYQAPALWPPGALKGSQGAAVLLEIDISAQGEVTGVRVLEPAGQGFDEAAVLAARSFRFIPARDPAGQAVEARIQYRYLFTLEAAPPLVVEGQLRQAGDRSPLSGLELEVSGPQGEKALATTDAEGRFQLAGLAPGSWTLVAGGGRWRRETVRFDVVPGEVASLQLWLRPLGSEPSAQEELVVEGDRLPPEVLRRTLSSDELSHVAGTGGDMVRAIQSLPGVARPPFNGGQLLIRGTGPGESGYYLGGGRLSDVFHFGGLSTVVNPDTLTEVRFLPGAYGVRHGGHLGGVVELVTSPEAPSRAGGYLSVDLFQSTALVEVPISDGRGVVISARRSYIDVLAQPFIDLDPSVRLQLPRTADLSARYVSKRDLPMELMLFLSQDSFSVTSSSASGEELTTELSNGFQKVWLQLRPSYGGGWRGEHSLMAGPERKAVLYGDRGPFEEAKRFFTRQELSRPVPEGGVLGWRIGATLEVAEESYNYDIFGEAEGYVWGSGGSGEARVVRPAAYLEQVQRLGRLQATPGLRVDAVFIDGLEPITMIDPRIGLRRSLPRDWELQAGGGIYSQAPQLRELLPSSEGVPTLLPERSTQFALGASHELLPGLKAELTGYLALLEDLIIGQEDRFELSLSPPVSGTLDLRPYRNGGSGRTSGLEWLLRYSDDQTTAWWGLTWSRSIRVDDEEQQELFAYDQPLVLHILASRELSRGWRLGGRLRYGSGNPYFPVAHRYYDLGDGVWYPVGAEEQERLDAWRSLDLRVDKRWDLRRWSLTGYLDLMNATNARNVELLTWSGDYSDELPIYGLPILPAFGLRADW